MFILHFSLLTFPFSEFCRGFKTWDIFCLPTLRECQKRTKNKERRFKSQLPVRHGICRGISQKLFWPFRRCVRVKSSGKCKGVSRHFSHLLSFQKNFLLKAKRRGITKLLGYSIVKKFVQRQAFSKTFVHGNFTGIFISEYNEEKITAIVGHF